MSKKCGCLKKKKYRNKYVIQFDNKLHKIDYNKKKLIRLR